MPTRQSGRPKGTSPSNIPASTKELIAPLVHSTQMAMQAHIDHGGESIKMLDREFAVTDPAVGDPMLSLDPPKRVGRPSKATADFNNTNIGARRKEVLESIPSVIIKSLRQQSKLNRDKHYWLDNGLGYFCNGTLFNLFSMPLQSQEALDVKLSAILQGLVVYLHNNEGCYLVEEYLSTIGISAKWLEKAMKNAPEVAEAYELAMQLCQARLIKLGFQEGKSAMAKFALQSKHGLVERRSVETTNFTVTGGEEKLKELIKENNSKNLMQLLDKQLKGE